MGGVGGVGVDPFPQEFFLLRREWLLELRGRHDEVWIGRLDPGDQFALGDGAGHDRPRARRQFGEGGGAFVEPQVSLPRMRVAAVAVVAVGGEDRPDVAGEVDCPDGISREGRRDHDREGGHPVGDDWI